MLLVDSGMISTFFKSHNTETFFILSFTISCKMISLLINFTELASNLDNFNIEFTKKLILMISLFISLTNYILVSLSISGLSKILSIIIVIDVKGVFS